MGASLFSPGKIYILVIYRKNHPPFPINYYLPNKHIERILQKAPITPSLFTKKATKHGLLNLFINETGEKVFCLQFYGN